MNKFAIEIEGGGTREDIAVALRLIASAMDGKGEFPSQSVEAIEGAKWNDGTLRVNKFTIK